MPTQWEFEAIGTHWVIASSTELTTRVKHSIGDQIEQFDQTYSRFRTDSTVWKICQAAGDYELPDDAHSMIDLYRKLYDVSDGLVTPLIGKTMEQAGYDKDYTLAVGTLTHPPSWQESMDYDSPTLRIKQPGVLLDFGAAGKGYLVDLIAAKLRDAGIQDFVINAGGDIWVEAGAEQIGLEDPHNAERVIGQVSVRHQGLCASSPNRRAWADMHHIINPKTLQPEQHATATWVIADSCMLADGLATALSFVAPDVLRKHFEFEYAMISAGNLYMSKNFNAEWFTTHE